MEIKLEDAPDTLDALAALTKNPEVISSFDELLGPTESIKAPPPLTNDYTKVSTVPDENPDPLPAKSSQPPSEIIVELCGSMLSDVESIGLSDVMKSTITYVDNDNKSVLLVNKYLMSMGHIPIPIIAPGLAPKFLAAIPQADTIVGDILLYSTEDGGSNLGILIAPIRDTAAAKVLTTHGAIIQMSVIQLDNVHAFMR